MQSSGWWSQKSPLAKVDGSSKSIYSCLNIYLLLVPINFLVYCSNYDRRNYKLWYKVPSSSEEDIREHLCASTDPEAVMTMSPLPKGKH